MENGWRLERTAQESRGSRMKKRLLAKTCWYKKRKAEDLYRRGGKKGRRQMESEEAPQQRFEHKYVLFIPQTPMGRAGNCCGT